MLEMNKTMSKTAGTLLIGAALGYAASLLLSPESRSKQTQLLKEKSEKLKDILSDPEERERIADIFQENTRQASERYMDIKDRFISLLAQTRGSLAKIDRQKYLYAVEETIQQLKENGELPKEQIEKLKKYLRGDFQKIKNNVALS